MLFDFLKDCKCALSEESADYQALLKLLEGMPVHVAFMPSITDDLYPVHALSCTSAKKIISPNVYIVPVGAHNNWAVVYFEGIINKFYLDDELREQYDIELEEMILLSNPKLNSSFTLYDGTNYNVAIICITMSDGSGKYLIVVPENPENCWNTIIESNNIRCDILIDSHKGLGNWLDSIPLYGILRETNQTELLPKFYFKGLYISHDAPFGFHKIYTIPDTIYHNFSNPIENWQKEIYEINWDENRSQRTD